MQPPGDGTGSPQQEEIQHGEVDPLEGRQQEGVQSTSSPGAFAVVPGHLPDSGDYSEDDEVSCRICRQGEEAGKLYCPCRCAGSIKWIHESCLRSWLQAQDRRPVCELCGYVFEYTRVYSEHAPHRLTVGDWLGAAKSSIMSVGRRGLRILYAIIVWGIALPLLTVNSAHTLYGRGRGLSPTELRYVLPVMLNIFMGECLSVAGIAVIYLNSLIPNLIGVLARSTTAPVTTATERAPPAADESPAPTEEDRPPVPDGSGEQASEAPGPPPEPAPLDEPPAESAPPDALATATAEGASQEEEDPEEDLWNILGVQGNPLRALGCMVTFLGANVIGIGLFLATPFHVGRAVITWLLPFYERPLGGADLLSISRWTLRLLGIEVPVEAGHTPTGTASSLPSTLLAQDGQLLPEAFLNASDTSSTVEFIGSHELPPPGQNPLLDVGALTMGYLSLVSLLLALIPSSLLVGAAFGSVTRGPEVMRAFAVMLLSQARQAFVSVWVKLQMVAILLLQLVLVPCYIGHLVVCLLCGPVLHLPQGTRAAMANGNLPLTLVMQLFIGYVHLWGIAFLEGCVADIFIPAVLRSASSNFFIGALCSHRRLFGTGGVSSSADWPLLLPVSHLTALKLALVHVAFHTPLAFTLWHLPARMLDRLLGEMLFPVHLVDHMAGPPGLLRNHTVSRRDLVLPPGSDAGTPELDRAPQPGESQPFFAIEMLQLYILVLQCLRVLDASPGLARLIAAGLRSTFRWIGLQHLLSDPSTTGAVSSAVPSGSAESTLQSLMSPVPRGFRIVDGSDLEVRASDQPVIPPERVPTIEQDAGEARQLPTPQPQRPLLVLGQLLVVAGLLVVFSWTGMVLVLSLPLTVGRMLVRYFLSTQAKRVSDFLPLSLGVVVFSAGILAVVKVSEALPVICARASTLEQRRCIHLLFCTMSSVAMAGATLVLIPLGFGTLLLRLVLPLKAHSVYQVPIVFLVTDCWGLGMVLTKVLWRLVQTDVALHSLHLEFAAAWNDVQGSLTNLFFDLRAHRRIWRRLIVPLLEAITLHLLFPRTVALTLLQCCIPEEQEFIRSALLMYCYHLVLGVRLWFAVLPAAQSWITDVRQRIFDDKYLVSTELQNYHPLNAN